MSKEKKSEKKVEKKHSSSSRKIKISTEHEQRLKDINVPMFHHQETSVLNLEERESKKSITFRNLKIDTNIILFSDLPGYGKTRSVLALIQRDKMEWDMSTPYITENISEFRYNNIICKSLTEYKRVDSTFLVCSASILDQWLNEIKLFKLKHKVIKASKDFDFNANKYDIVLCVTTMYNKYMKHVNGEYDQHPKAWKRFIYDEPASTKISAMKQIIFGSGIFITATPNPLLTITGQRHFVRNLFNRMNLELFSAITIKNDDDYVRASYQLPPTTIIEYKCLQNSVISVVKDIISNDIINMISAGNIDGAIRSLGGQNSDKSIIEIVSDKKEAELKEALAKIDKYKKRKAVGDAAKVKKWKEKKTKLEEEIEKLRERFANILKDPCSVCYSELNKPVMVSCCQNIFCGECILKWLEKNDNCPLCRKIITAKNLISVSNNEKKEEGKGDEKKEVKIDKSKTETLIDIVEKYSDEKILIFSDYDDSFVSIRNALKGHKYVEIKGSAAVREKNIDKYKTGNVNIILLNSKYNGAGINLQNTDHIIFYHQMTKDVEDQNIGRAKRIGNKKTLTVHKLN
jgi:hypothetical protein